MSLMLSNRFMNWKKNEGEKSKLNNEFINENLKSQREKETEKIKENSTQSWDWDSNHAYN